MIDLKDLKSRKQEISENIKNRFMNVDLDGIIAIQEERSKLLHKSEELRSQRNSNASKMKGKLEPSDRQQLIAQGKELKVEIAAVEENLKATLEKYNALTRTIPNYAHPSAPIGKEDKDNTAIRFFGEPTKFDFKALDHVQLGEKLDILDFEKGTKVSGPKYYYVKNKGVILQMALERFVTDILINKGFTPFITPDVAKEEILNGIGFNPRGAESNIYTIENTDTCLVGTAEITLGGYYSNEILNKADLPIKMSGLSHCFRREAGGAGQYSKGLYRVHQFSKLEMFVICLPEDSDKIHQQLLDIEEEIFSSLEIPYRVVDTCTGDLGAPAYRKFDIEAWMPGRGESGEYGEVTSTSNCTDYQARSLQIRYKDENNNNQYVHMLNGTAIALSRAIVAIMENFQNRDGSISMPKALIPYTNFEVIEARK
jgi:seryl-tRNA synthetase